MPELADSSSVRNPAILLVGPTGSGKTPLGQVLEARGLCGAQCWHFDFGANLRSIVEQNQPDELVRREDIDFLRTVLDAGALLEDEHFPLAERILRRFMMARGADPHTWLVLNGLPRHVGQARAIDAMLQVRIVAHLACSGETVLARIRANTGGDRGGRIDDNRESVRAKLAIFASRTAPLLEYYAAQRALIAAISVTPTMSAKEMWEALEAAAEKGFRVQGSGSGYRP